MKLRNEIVKLRNPHDLTGGVTYKLKNSKKIGKKFCEKFLAMQHRGIFRYSAFLTQAPEGRIFWKIFFGKNFGKKFGKKIWKKIWKKNLEKFLRDVTYRGFCMLFVVLHAFAGVLADSADSCETVRILRMSAGRLAKNLRKSKR